MNFFPCLKIFLLAFYSFRLQWFDVDIFNYVLEHSSLQQHVGTLQCCVFRKQSVAFTPGFSRSAYCHLLYVTSLPRHPVPRPWLHLCAIRFEHCSLLSPRHHILVHLLNSRQKSTCSPPLKLITDYRVHE